jgi:DNA-binding XRE family transcriptional regulator
MSHPESRTAFFRASTAASFGAALRGARQEAGMTQQQLADAVGTNRRTIVRLEAGSAVSMGVAVDAVRAVGRDIALIPRFSRLEVRE